MLAGLQAVDFVTVFADATPLALIEAVRPDVLVRVRTTGRPKWWGPTFVERYGGRVHLAPLPRRLLDDRR